MLTLHQSVRAIACALFFCAFFAGHVRALESNSSYWQEERGRVAQPERVAHGSVAQMVVAAARRHGVPPHLALGVARVESGLRCNARNGGARGVMQVFPQTAHSVGVHGNLLDCATGIEAGVRYLRLALDRAGSECKAASLYNRGIYARPSCDSYARKVMRQS